MKPYIPALLRILKLCFYWGLGLYEIVLNGVRKHWNILFITAIILKITITVQAYINLMSVSDI